LKSFLWATILGSIAGNIAYALAGSSIEGDFTGKLPAINPWVLGLAALFLLLSFTIAWYLRRQKISKPTYPHG
jgi:uncharacterized membrane protein YdjX (TVP38/TMEM64 family)